MTKKQDFFGRAVFRPLHAFSIQSLITRAVKRHELRFRYFYQIRLYFWGRDRPRDETSGHELLFSISFFVLGWHELSFRHVIKFFKFSVAFFALGP